MSRPSLFLDLGFDAALALSYAEKRLLLVDATATWCQPCQSMDRTTWSDARVQSRLAELAVSIQLDVDADPRTAKMLRIKSMPTVVLFRDGVELDRVSGARGPDALLGWIEGVLAGRTEVDGLREAAVEVDIKARRALFLSLLERQEYVEATELGVWLWENMLVHMPSMRGVRRSYFVTELTRLVAAHSPAAAEIRRLRDRAKVQYDEDESLDKLADWLSLNKVLGEQERTVSWFDEIVDHLGEDDKLSALVQNEVVPLLVTRERWRDVGRAYPDPMSALRRRIELAHQVRESGASLPQGQGLIDFATRSLRTDCATNVTGLRAAGRVDEAHAVAAAAMLEDPSPELAHALDEATRRADAARAEPSPASD